MYDWRCNVARQILISLYFYLQWSIRNTSSTPGTKDVWTDTEKESDDIALSDRSDSGVTSPNSHHHLDDRQSVSPCDLSVSTP